jgi:hypothetical protein
VHIYFWLDSFSVNNRQGVPNHGYVLFWRQGIRLQTQGEEHMTQDEIIEMWNSVIKYAPSEVRITEFAKLVAAKATASEREACANLCQHFLITPEILEWATNRASLWDVATCQCAGAIRARGEA